MCNGDDYFFSLEYCTELHREWIQLYNRIDPIIKKRLVEALISPVQCIRARAVRLVELQRYRDRKNDT